MASNNSGYVAANGPRQRQSLICYLCGKPGHKSVVCRSKFLNPTPSGNFVKGQWPSKRPDTTSNGKHKLPQSNMIVLSYEDESNLIDYGIILTAGRGHVPNRNFGSKSLNWRKRDWKLNFGYLIRNISCVFEILRNDYQSRTNSPNQRPIYGGKRISSEQRKIDRANRSFRQNWNNAQISFLGYKPIARIARLRLPPQKQGRLIKLI